MIKNHRTAHRSSALWAICGTGIGLFLLFFPGTVLRFLSLVVGIFCASFGIFRLIEGMHEERCGGSSVFVGVFAFLFGMYVTVGMRDVVLLFPLAAGIISFVNGIGKISTAFVLRPVGGNRWRTTLLMGILFAGAGIGLIIFRNAAITGLLRIIGLLILFDGIGELWVMTTLHKTDFSKSGEQTQAEHPGQIDGEFRDISDISPDSDKGEDDK